ncbi:MAG: carotenoid oxygenase family protein [Cyanobacteria bacterium P01_H01_bin.35]
MLFQVSGHIYETENGAGIPDLVVKAFDKDLIKDDDLGEALTDSQGNFKIIYSEKDFKGIGEMFEGNPDLYIVVKTPERHRVLYTSKQNIRREATVDEHFEIGITKASLQQTNSFQDDENLLKVLIGIAWIDGVLEPAEEKYIKQIAINKKLTDNDEIEALLNQPVPVEQCYEWLQEYLGKNPTHEKYQELYENISSLISSDNKVDTQEAELLQFLSDQKTRSQKLQERLMKIFLDSKFIGKVISDTGEGARIANQGVRTSGYYARIPNLILSQFQSAKSDSLLKDDMSKIYLDDNFAPVDKETTADELQVIGELPQELSGMFLRNGPNPQFQPLELYHWFDGDGMIHNVNISNGKASYRNRYVRTEAFEIEKQAGKAIWPGLMNLPRFDGPHGIMMKNVANTSLVWHAGKLLALWEAGEPYIIDASSLETLGSYTFGGKLESTFTAHPKIDPVTGEMIFFGCSFIIPPYLQYGVISAEGEILQTVPIDLPSPVMMHDFAITEHYSIFLDLPLAFQPMRMMDGKLPINFEWKRLSRIGVVPRHGDNSSIRWFSIPPCMVIHTANAYEEGDEVILVACRMKYCNLLMPFYDKNNRLGEIDLETLELFRWRLNLKTGSVTEEVIDPIPSEFPRINDGLLGRKMRYVYASRVAGYMKPKPLFDGIIKYDLEKDSTQTHELGRGRFCGEITFAPRPGGIAEDDGWLLTFVWDAVAKQAELLVVDAQDVTGKAIARVLIPERVPYGFHVTWLSSEQML